MHSENTTSEEETSECAQLVLLIVSPGVLQTLSILSIKIKSISVKESLFVLVLLQVFGAISAVQ